MSDSKETAVIFEVREFCLHDGPGVRTTVFFKGCPLRCTWCHNPEGLSPEPEMIFKSRRCRHCGNCGLDTSGRLKADVDLSRLERICPNRARMICGKRWTVDALAKELLSNVDVFSASGGGVTFSGGEPLLQTGFLERLAIRLRAEAPIHLAIETSGFAPQEDYQRGISQMDLVFQDLKHPDPVAHRRWTGVDPAPILANLRWLKSSGKPFVARIPLMPGVNDAADVKESFARLLDGHSGLQRVELLPYHATAAAKYPFVGRTYQPGFDVSRAPDTDITPFARYGIEAKVM